MKKLALMMLALELAVCGCGSSPNTNNNITTTTTGNWETQLIGGRGAQAQLNFVASFNVTSTTGGTAQPLDITGFNFFNQGECFANGTDQETVAGSATLNTNNAGQVTGGLTMTITSNANGNVLTLTSPNGLTGTSTGTSTTTGTLNNGVVVGSWTLSSSDQNCNNTNPGGTNTFIMCQGTPSCTPP